MKNSNSLFFAFLLLLGFTACTPKDSLHWVPFQWEGDTISGKYIEKAFLYVPVQIENLPDTFTMQFDLGTYNTLLYENTAAPFLEQMDWFAEKMDSTRMLRGMTLYLNGQPVLVNAGYKADFGEPASDDSTPPTIGTIGSDLFENKVLIIDYKQERFAIADHLPEMYKSVSFVEFENQDGFVKLPFEINGESQNLMFDTGSSPFQLVTTQDRVMAIADPHLVDSLSGPLWWGNMITFYGYHVDKPVRIGSISPENVMVYYDKEGLWTAVFNAFSVWGITGNAFFFDYTIILDYQTNRFYIQK